MYVDMYVSHWVANSCFYDCKSTGVGDISAKIGISNTLLVRFIYLFVRAFLQDVVKMKNCKYSIIAILS